MSRLLTVATIVGGAIVAYGFYFDYQRRNSPEFRKKLKKNFKKYKNELSKKEHEEKKEKYVSIKDKLEESLSVDPLPTDIKEKEQYFLKQVSAGEQLAAIPGMEYDAAIGFYKGLAVYPSPTELLNIYQKTVPEKIYDLVVMLIAIQPPQAVINILGDNVNGGVAVEIEQD
ncbi:hypothetical protein PACTADRAFT_52131 [Pachysolen tannophilus NRRL Y-2460]|uniref:Mitochondrial import receptor subunit TOM20 n=1 Tax=Pachysolen tannophilus NRRL Y-2460 TaxID=669874 RepID=A0A1E4TMY7_PACTA|nr:hypothetical protein PACTADRAFT_52131 [Pachysolen tannophilus NRRL Y-2460]